MKQDVVTLILTEAQFDALTSALSFYEQLCRGDLDELALLMEQGTIVNFTASNEPIVPVSTQQLATQVRPILRTASQVLGYPPGARLTHDQVKDGHVERLLAVLTAMIGHRDALCADDLPACEREGENRTIRIGMKHAYAVKDALDVYVRVCLGQFNIVTESVLSHHILCYAPEGQKPMALSSDTAWGPIQDAMNRLKRALSFPLNGSYGIGHPHVHITAHRGWEILKVLSRALAERREPKKNATLRGVDYDGLIVRYTDDPAPVAHVTSSVSLAS